MITKKPKVLVVDDDRSALKFISANLLARNYEVVTAHDGVEALEQLKEHIIDLIILDMMMPRMDGLEVCRRVRTYSTVPIIVLSGLQDEEKKVQALDLGADDYLTKPFGLQELLARVRAALRRAGFSAYAPVTAPEEPFRAGNLAIDYAARRVSLNAEDVHLTPTEYTLLCELARSRGTVLTHDVLLRRVWGPESGGNSQYLHMYIGRLRQKLAKLQGVEIVTEPGVGYVLRDGQS